MPPPRRALRSRSVPLAVVPVLAVAFSGCGEDEEHAYCVDQNDVVVENRYCDDDRSSGAFFWYFGGSQLLRGGERAPAGGERIRASDKAALARRGGFGSSRPAGSGVGRSFGGGGFSGGG